jgi:hypothetical protein
MEVKLVGLRGGSREKRRPFLIFSPDLPLESFFRTSTGPSAAIWWRLASYIECLFSFFVPPNKPPSNRLLTLSQDEYRSEAGSVVEVDFYHANQLLPLPDDVLVDRVLNKYLAGCEPSFRAATVVDSSVLKFKGAVTLFGPGSHQVTRVCGLVLVWSFVECFVWLFWRCFVWLFVSCSGWFFYACLFRLTIVSFPLPNVSDWDRGTWPQNFC